jgi:RNA-directed DNA polymerase
MPNPAVLSALARSFLAGEPDVEGIVARATGMLGKRHRWLKPLALRYVETFGGQTRPRRSDVIRFLAEERRKFSVQRWLTEAAKMQPVPAAEAWEIPPIETVGALTDWLHLDPGQPEWFADLRGIGTKHYYYRLLTKTDGSARLIEAPKSGLKYLQRRILSHILERIPPHLAVHGFIKRRSIKTFAAPHTGQRVVLRMDLKDFFPSFRAARIQAFFRTIGYPESVADLLGGICTTSAPQALCKLLPLHGQPHLPQGAPTSPALANLCFRRMDCRLTGLAQAAGASYTRYADDLAFSGGEAFERCVDRFPAHVAAILSEEDFRVNHRKTRIMRQGGRQHLAGLVVNDHLNIRRADFDLLKAILTNCARRGAGGENRAHLEGRVGFVESISPAKGLRLRSILDQISWP